MQQQSQWGSLPIMFEIMITIFPPISPITRSAGFSLAI